MLTVSDARDTSETTNMLFKLLLKIAQHLSEAALSEQEQSNLFFHHALKVALLDSIVPAVMQKIVQFI